MKALLHLPTLLKLSFQEWRDDKASRLAAALAYYTIFSLAPLLVLVIAITGLLWQKDVVQNQILGQIRGLVGAQGAGFVQTLITHQGTTGQSLFATIVGVIALVFGALGVFEALHDSLNTVWDVEEKKARGFWQGVKRVVIDRVISFTVILGIGFLLLVSLVISAGLSAVQGSLGGLLPVSGLVLQVVNAAISLAVITVLFALMFKILPDADIAWRDVWLGAFGTAVLFTIGKTLIGLYLGRSSVASSYGAAGSLILLLLWIYYSAQILFFGAEFTQVYANKYGSRIVPEADARSTEPQPPSHEKEEAPAARRDLRREPAATAAAARLPEGRFARLQFERRNQQTGRVLLWMMIASFFSGLFTTVFTFRKVGKGR